jgi:uncharacterized membrane protein
MTTEAFLTALLFISTLTSLTTEALKKWKQERDKKYYPNALAGYIAIIFSVLVGSGYIILTGSAVDARMVVYLVALAFLSWLVAMLGYDKVIQAILQFKFYNQADKED